MGPKRLDELMGGSSELFFKGKCHDCKKPVEVHVTATEEGFVISGGSVYEPNPGSGEFFLKCDKCYAKDDVLRDYQECEVYSRVVGYLRPVSQWNEGKKAEFDLRKSFKTEGI